ncbi:MAG: aminopeptidase [Thermoplasmata archaeon]|nr:aminopeptidase [Thermoplasmata archaeon]
MPLMDGARTAVNVCMGVKSRESVVIITDTGKRKIGEALFEAALEIAPKVLLAVMPPAARMGEEPIKMVGELMKTADVVFAPTTYSLTHTRARKLATKAGTRIATMPGITRGMMSSGGMTADFKEIQKSIKNMSRPLKNRKKVHITTTPGTDLSFSIEGRKWVLEDTGICRKKGGYTNLPAGEIFIAPVEGTASGKLVVDGAFMEKVKEPITVDIKKGLAVKFEGEGSEKVEAIFKESSEKLKEPKNAYNIAKFGIGMNPRSKIIGNILEDEKALGTIHIGFGGNYTFGGRVRAGMDIEGIVRTPTVEIDNELIVEIGKLKI